MFDTVLTRFSRRLDLGPGGFSDRIRKKSDGHRCGSRVSSFFFLFGHKNSSKMECRRRRRRRRHRIYRIDDIWRIRSIRCIRNGIRGTFFCVCPLFSFFLFLLYIFVISVLLGTRRPLSRPGIRALSRYRVFRLPSFSRLAAWRRFELPSFFFLIRFGRRSGNFVFFFDRPAVTVAKKKSIFFPQKAAHSRKRWGDFGLRLSPEVAVVFNGAKKKRQSMATVIDRTRRGSLLFIGRFPSTSQSQRSVRVLRLRRGSSAKKKKRPARRTQRKNDERLIFWTRLVSKKRLSSENRHQRSNGDQSGRF